MGKACTGKKYAIHKAIYKYGWDNFTKEIVMECEFDWEKIFIKEYNTLSPNGYNLTTGGDDDRPSDESRQRMSAAAKLRPPPPPFLRSNGLDQDFPKYVQFVPDRMG